MDNNNNLYKGLKVNICCFNLKHFYFLFIYFVGKHKQNMNNITKSWQWTFCLHKNPVASQLTTINFLTANELHLMGDLVDYYFYCYTTTSTINCWSYQTDYKTYHYYCSWTTSVNTTATNATVWVSNVVSVWFHDLSCERENMQTWFM